MNVEEMLVRRESQDLIEIGNILEAFYNSSAGTIIRAMINGRISEQFTMIEDVTTPADRRLGRAEGLQMLINDIELAIQDKDRLIQPLEASDGV